MMPTLGAKTGSRRSVRKSLADALFTKTQQRVFGVLFGQPERSFYASELIRDAGTGSGAAQRELARLEGSGLIVARRIGHQKHYQANAASPLYSELRNIVLKTVGLAEPLRDALKPLSSAIRAAFVYGSVAKLLRVLEERRFERLGGNRSIHVDFRLISATNRPLDQFVRDSRFREDLYYRVNAFSIRLPSLRERQVDIPVLANRFLARYCASNGLPMDSKSFSREAVDLLQVYHWPGNIRELESTVSRAALSSPGRSIRAADIEFLHATEPPAEESGERLPSLRDAERAHIVRILDACTWNKKEAARILEISRGTLYRKILEFGLEPQTNGGSSRNRARRLTGT